jgi:hypothetical protein
MAETLARAIVAVASARTGIQLVTARANRCRFTHRLDLSEEVRRGDVHDESWIIRTVARKRDELIGRLINIDPNRATRS